MTTNRNNFVSFQSLERAVKFISPSSVFVVFSRVTDDDPVCAPAYFSASVIRWSRYTSLAIFVRFLDTIELFTLSFAVVIAAVVSERNRPVRGNHLETVWLDSVERPRTDAKSFFAYHGTRATPTSYVRLRDDTRRLFH